MLLVFCVFRHLWAAASGFWHSCTGASGCLDIRARVLLGVQVSVHGSTGALGVKAPVHACTGASRSSGSATRAVLLGVLGVGTQALLNQR